MYPTLSLSFLRWVENPRPQTKNRCQPANKENICCWQRNLITKEVCSFEKLKFCCDEGQRSPTS